MPAPSHSPTALPQLWRMAPDNFTPPERTPWGGRVILDQLKAGLQLDPTKAAYSVVGESWEISVEPSFPSRIANLPGEPSLAEVIAVDPVAALGPAVARRHGGCPLLVKLLDSAQPLSVQVHPDDDYAGLTPTQSGKPESWVIVAHAPGAGLYLGLAEGVWRADIEACLSSDGDLEPLLNFVEVAPGDCFEIGPGTVHAIGPGVTLVEPQAVLPGREGVTYRFWDWNRRYDASGQLDPLGGRPRPLHLAHSLAVTRFDGPRGPAFVESVRRHPVEIDSAGGAVLERLVVNDAFLVERARGTGRLEIGAGGSMLALVCVEGALACDVGGRRYAVRRGESAVLPHCLLPASLELTDCLVIAARPF